MQQRESEALLDATHRLIDETDADHRFTARDICDIHRLWLGELYEWAGRYRSVNVSREGFMFAAAEQVPKLMQELEDGPLRKYTPCHFVDRLDQARAIGETHAELILIHPFRDGNGRCARLLATLMGVQAGLPALNFRGIAGQERSRYIGAIQASMERNYEPITAVFDRVISRTVRSASRAG
jgi:cell filamentation protein